MSIEIKAPAFPESITEGTIAVWHKRPREFVKQDENLVDIETDKVVLEVVAPQDGFIESIQKKEGETVKSEEVIGLFQVNGVPKKEEGKGEKPAEKPKEKPADKKSELGSKNKKEEEVKSKSKPEEMELTSASPAVRRLAEERDIKLATIQGTGESGRITKEDVLKVAENSKAPISRLETKGKETVENKAVVFPMGERTEKRVPMSRLRARIAERLLQAQSTAAILTTFNEINMQPVVGLRQKYKETFEKTYGVRLGFMSFFTIAVVEALKKFPAVNASIDGSDIVYHDYYDIGIAVSSPRGLVVPIIRNAERLHAAQIEKKIVEYSQKAQEGHLTIEEITGGTFTISNGGVFGSLMSTPILNPPQSGILGLHKIEERPIVENGVVVVRPMMYVALSYDHRIIDGSESVRFLVTIKELLEDPARFILDI